MRRPDPAIVRAERIWFTATAGARRDHLLGPRPDWQAYSWAIQDAVRAYRRELSPATFASARR